MEVVFLILESLVLCSDEREAIGRSNKKVHNASPGMQLHRGCASDRSQNPILPLDIHNVGGIATSPIIYDVQRYFAINTTKVNQGDSSFVRFQQCAKHQVLILWQRQVYRLLYKGIVVFRDLQHVCSGTS